MVITWLFFSTGQAQHGGMGGSGGMDISKCEEIHLV